MDGDARTHARCSRPPYAGRAVPPVSREPKHACQVGTRARIRMQTMSSAHARSGNRTVAVLVTHDRPQLLLEALQALASQTRRASRLIVVDNGRDRATRDVL